MEVFGYFLKAIDDKKEKKSNREEKSPND